ncbi:hypothetical protein [Accumulibacter sp.]|uniref:hypothetical protein n=1 Tax=Accumulibacter sp. TaxID=2053492 RepID=UPI0028C3B226|nr:hypothetical protein [Accumulibacter sp.]
MADATRIEKTITALPPGASQALGTRVDNPSTLPPAGDGAAAVPPPLPQAIERLSQDVQAIPQAVKKAPGELAEIPRTVATKLPGELRPVEAYLEAKLPVIDALPLPDFFFGGGVLVAVVILQAIGLRLLTGHFDKRAQHIQQRPAWWSVDVLLGFTVFRMLGLHLMSIVLWSAALVYSGIIPQWAAAARFAALSYTTLGSHRELSDEWYMLSPIIAISGMFTFAWTASVLVSIVGRCNELRGIVRDARRAKRGAATRSTRPTTGPGEATAAAGAEERTPGS